VLLLHAIALRADDTAAGSHAAAPRAVLMPMLVKVREAPLPPQAPPVAEVLPAVPAALPVLPAAPSARSLRKLPAAPPEPQPARAELVALASPAVAEAVAPVAASAAAAPAPHGVDVPVYATRMPPSVHWVYEMRYGFLSGRGDLVWTREGDRYEARLEGRVAGFSILDWASSGMIDAAGVAPERFVVRRRGKETLAANFQRHAGKITYSGPTTEHPLPMGAQDRLSLLLQLTAIVAGDPQRFAKSDAHIVVFVSGARADADVWTFDIVGDESVDTQRGPVRALHLRREPRGPRDTRLDVWLDPARHHLPVRASLANPGGGDALELLLTDETPSS
jgi:hypothetical protein